MDEQKAISFFRSGLNCAQSVLTTYTPKYRIDDATALAISCSFGGGMGRLQETCGAVTGAFMVIGIHNSQKYADNGMRKNISYQMVQDFDKEFRKIHGTIKCNELLNVDLRTEAGQKSFHDGNMGEKICEQCIANATKIIDRLLM
jgi:C_GCAxxG_C_C family probable redox protein